MLAFLRKVHAHWKRWNSTRIVRLKTARDEALRRERDFQMHRVKPFDEQGHRITFWGDLDNPGLKRTEYPVFDVAAPRSA